MIRVRTDRREDIYRILDSEREYQRRKWGIPPMKIDGEPLEDAQHTPDEYLAYMQHYLTEGLAQISKEADNNNALDTIRKITAMGVACMEQNGCRYRDINVKNARGWKTV